MSGSGLQPGSKYTLTLRSEPVVLFTGNADPSGYFDTEFNLSSVNCPTPGRHTLTLTGVRPDGSQTSAETAFSIDEGCRVSSISRDGYDQTDLATVYFSSGSSKLSNKAKASIKSAVEANPAAIYRVIGYVQKSFISRNDGSLSLSRARAVANYLGSLNAEVNFTVVSESGFISPVDSKSAKARKATLFAVTPSVR
jgi:outer membrane protein OmpA-like peptidoglycan-associated protein